MKKISILLLVLWGVIPSMLFAQRQLSFLVLKMNLLNLKFIIFNLKFKK